MNKRRRWRWTWYNIKCVLIGGSYFGWFVWIIWQMLPPVAQRFTKYLIVWLIIYKIIDWLIPKK